MTNIASTMSGLAKEVYADKEEKLFLTDQSTVIADTLGFMEGDQQPGNLFHFPAVMSREHGMSFALGSTRTAFSVVDAVAAQSVDGQARGAEFLIQGSISYGMMATLEKTADSGKKRAFVMGTKYVIENLRDSSRFARELMCAYGGGDAASATGTEGIGEILARTNDSGTSQTFSLTEGSWAVGIWAGMVNGYVDVYDATLATKRNAAGTMQITAIDLDSRTFTALGTEAEMDTIVATDRIFLRGSKGAEGVGLVKIGKNTGTLHNVSASTYPLWKGVNLTTTGALTFSKIMRAIIRSAAFGNAGEYVFFVSLGGWVDMMNNLAALRQFAANGGGKIEQGASDLVYFGPNGSKVTFKATPIMKDGMAIGVNPRHTMRIGASDDSNRLPGSPDNDFFFQLPSNAGVGLRRYWNQTVISRRPMSITIINGITNNAF